MKKHRQGSDQAGVWCMRGQFYRDGFCPPLRRRPVLAGPSIGTRALIRSASDLRIAFVRRNLGTPWGRRHEVVFQWAEMIFGWRCPVFSTAIRRQSRYTRCPRRPTPWRVFSFIGIEVTHHADAARGVACKRRSLSSLFFTLTLRKSPASASVSVCRGRNSPEGR